MDGWVVGWVGTVRGRGGGTERGHSLPASPGPGSSSVALLTKSDAKQIQTEERPGGELTACDQHRWRDQLCTHSPCLSLLGGLLVVPTSGLLVCH